MISVFSNFRGIISETTETVLFDGNRLHVRNKQGHFTSGRDVTMSHAIGKSFCLVNALQFFPLASEDHKS